MRGPRFLSLLRWEARELLASRAFLLLLLLTGLLAGQSFITAVGLYAEASRGAGNSLAAALSPLDGMLVPTFGAYDLAASLLWPFVAIRLLSASKQQGGLALLLQTKASIAAQLSAKVLVLMAGWLLAFLPGLLCLGLWRSYGGHLHYPEVANLLLGHFLRGFLATAAALLAAALSETASSAAILALGFTLGTWVLDFAAAGKGGWIRPLAAATPAAALRGFEQGLLSYGPLVAMLALGSGFLAAAGFCLHPGRPRTIVALKAAGALAATAFVLMASVHLHGGLDLSEARKNSFAPEVESGLRAFPEPLRIEVFLAPWDPRFLDLDQSLLAKLQRVVPRIEVVLRARTRSGQFEAAEDHYGEVWYQAGGRREMSRSTSEEEVLPLIFHLAGRSMPFGNEPSDPPPAGHPLVARPRYAAWLCFGLWPLLVALAAAWIHRPRRTS